MQPEIPQTPANGAEQMPLPPNMGGEQIPTLPPLDAGVERGAERREQAAEAGVIAGNIATPMAPPSIPHAPVDMPSLGNPPVNVSGPVTAADDDLIEKEWVDKAKSIVESTMDNPHARTDQVSQLRQDYRKKRYGDDASAAA